MFHVKQAALSRRFLTVGALLSGIVVLGAHAGMAAPSPRTAPPPPVGFAPCAACHSVNAGGPNRLGPNLFDIAGRKAGSKPDFAYSPALKGSRITWTRATLIAFLNDPARSVPGSRMPYPGTKDPKLSAPLADYLLSLK